MTAQQLLQTASQHHQNGRLDEAEEIYRRLLAADENDAEVLHLLGLLVSQRGDLVAGRDLVRRAIAIRPNAEVFHVNYGSLSAACRLPEEAVAAFQKAIELNRNSPAIVYAELGQALASLDRNTEAVYALEWAVKREPAGQWLVMLSEVLLRLGRQQDALDRLEQAIRLRPDLAEAHGALGLAMERENRLAEAQQCYREAIKLKPELFGAYNNLGHVLNRQRRWGEAAVELERAVQLRPDFATAHHNLGIALRGSNRLDEALHSYQQAVDLNPNLPLVWESLGNLLMERRQLPESAQALRRAIALRPSPGACVSLGRVLGGLDQFDEALAVLRQAVELAPRAAEPQRALGASLQWCGKMDEAMAAFRRAIELDPKSFPAGSHLLYAMLFHGGFKPEEIFSAHREWARRHTGHIPQMPPADIDLSPHRRLRIGYVSPNFRNQAIMSFVLPMIENHNPAAVEVYCYSDTHAPDAWTVRLQKHVHRWRDSGGLSDRELSERIRSDRIDILVDLTGHIGDGRLRTFAAKPAPVQVSYLGYQATTGLNAMDYFLTDNWADPVGQTEKYFTEKLIRITDAFFCYQPPEDAPDIVPLPAADARPITFGCQNNLAKVTPKTLALWCRVLSHVPESKMLLLAPNAREVDERILTAFSAAGISANRIELVRRATQSEYLDRYNRIDIALDPIPFNGHTTTCDAAWMGCPTVMLAGPIFPYRYGGSVLRNLGLADLIAGDENEYVRMAVALAADRQRLAHIRSCLRETMQRSPICDGARFAAKLEWAYRQMWESHTSARGNNTAGL